MKKIFKVVMIILIILTLVGCVGYKFLNGPSVKIKDKIEIRKYVENYLTKKYGEHKFKVTSIRYEYHRSTMAEMFDYSNPTGYFVHFKSDIVSDSWITINGLNSNDYKVTSDYFIQSYYFPDQDVEYIVETMNNMKPKKELEAILLNELRDEFEPDVYKIEAATISLNIPEDYGKIPTLEELKNNLNLYKVTQFNYEVSNAIEDPNEYEERLKSYITSKYKSDSDIYFHLDNTYVSVFLEDENT